MTANQKLADQIEQLGLHINKLIWIAGDPDGHAIRDLFDDINQDDLQDMFGEKIAQALLEAKDDERQYIFHENGLNGFIAECYKHECHNFSFDEKTGRPNSWSVSRGISRIFYVYAETPSQLVKAMRPIAKKMFDQFVIKEKEQLAETEA